MAKISSVKKQYTQAEAVAKINEMYNKLLTKGDAAQIAMAKKAMLVAKNCTGLMDAANTAMLNGQPHTALLLALKAAQTAPTNLVAQNNTAALLTQYGYPEQAIPFLQKINNEQKGNSTVLNNLAFAWLGLSDTQKAYQFAAASVMHNPQHPQSRLCAAVILEKEGKTAEAKQQIEIAKKFNNTKLTEQINKNSGNQENPIVKMSWEELKKKISVYEFFPKGWRNTYQPKENTLLYNEQFRADFAADQKMRASFTKKTETLIKAKQKLSDAEMNDANAMMKKAMGMDGKTIEFSVTANRVMGTIMQAFAEQRNTIWQKQLKVLANEKTKRETAKIEGLGGSNKSCDQMKPFIDKHHQKNMEEYNPTLLNFLTELEEEYRFFYNAMATWTMLQSNPTNKEAMEIEFLGLVKDFGTGGNGDLDLWWKYYSVSPSNCSGSNTPPPPATASVNTEPEIPNYNCLIIFKIPSGFSGNSFNKFDNDFGITANNNNSSPSMSTAYGTSGSRIAEPGLMSDSYVNSDGSIIEPSIGTSDDDIVYHPLYTQSELESFKEVLYPLPDLPKPSEVNSSWVDDEVVPLPYVPTAKEKAAQLKAARDVVKKLTDEYMSTSCRDEKEKKKKNKEKWDEKIRKANENIEKWLEEQDAKATKLAEKNKKTPLRTFNGEDEELTPLPILEKEKMMEKVKQKYNDMKGALKEAMDNSGLTETLNNGFTLPGKIAGYVTGLFN